MLHLKCRWTFVTRCEFGKVSHISWQTHHAVKTLDVNRLLISIEILTHRGRLTHICVSELIVIGSDNGLSPGWRQAIIWTNAGNIVNKLQWNFNWNSNIFFQENVFESVVCEMLAMLSRPQCVYSVGYLTVLMNRTYDKGTKYWKYVIHSCVQQSNKSCLGYWRTQWKIEAYIIP